MWMSCTSISSSVCLFVQEMTGTASAANAATIQHNSTGIQLQLGTNASFRSIDILKIRPTITQKGFSHIFAFYCCLLQKYSRLSQQRLTNTKKECKIKKHKNSKTKALTNESV